MNCVDELNELWMSFQECSENIQQKTRLAQNLLLQLSEILETPETTIADFDLPSSEPVENLATQIFTSSFPTQEKLPEPNWSTWTSPTMTLTARTIRQLWKEWKEGTDTKPSVEYMNAKFGELKWTCSEEDRTFALVGATIIREIEFHLENGRDLEEIFVVAELVHEELGGDLRRMARKIMDNSEQNKATLFETASSSVILSDC